MDPQYNYEVSDDEFQKHVEIIKKTKGYLGYGTDDAVIDNIKNWRQFFMPSSFFGHLLNEDVSIVSNFQGIEDIFSTDSWGITKNRLSAQNTINRIQHARENGIPVITIFGGSTIQGVGSRILEYTIPSLLEKILEKNYNIKCVCINQGVSGWCSSEQLNYLIHGIKYVPDVCIFYDGWNCLWNFYYGNLLNANSSLNKKPYLWRSGTSLRHYEYDLVNFNGFNEFYNLKKGINLFLNGFLVGIRKLFSNDNWFKMWNSIINKLFPIKKTDIFNQLPNKKLSDEERNLIITESVKEYLRIDSIAATINHSRGTKYLHFIQPMLWTTERNLTDKEKELLFLGQKMPNPEIFSLFVDFIKKENWPNHLIDATGLFTDIESHVFLDDGHLNGLGNFYVASKIAEELIDRKTFNLNYNKN